MQLKMSLQIWLAHMILLTVRLPALTSAQQYNYTEVLEKSIWFFEVQRSGKLPPDNRVPWRADSALDDGQDFGLDLTGGWYDAGDHVKFHWPMAYSTAVLAWGIWAFREAYDATGLTNQALDSIRWSLDYFIKCHGIQDDVTSYYYAQVGNATADHAYWGRPENMTMPRPAFEISPDKPGSDLAAETAAAMAAASLAFRDVDQQYANTLIYHARRLYDFAYDYRGFYWEHMPNDNYPNNNYDDELAWGAIWLYHATYEQKYLDYTREFYEDRPAWAFYWQNKNPGVQVLLYKAISEPQYRDDIQEFLNTWFPGGSVTYTPKGLAWRTEWGCLRYTALTSTIALTAAHYGLVFTTANGTDSTEWARGQMHYILGDAGRSYVQGIGVNPPQRSHHRAASCNPDMSVPCSWEDSRSPDPNPNTLYGAMVGGPDQFDVFVDNRTDYKQTEVGCDYNAALQTSIAGLIQLDLQNQKIRER